MNIKLYDYQEEAIKSLWEFFKTHGKGNPIVAMPTGSGKSVVIAGFIHLIFKKFHDQKVLVITHSKELISQNHERLLQMWPEAPAGICSAGLNQRDYAHSIIFGGIATVKGKAEKFGHVDLLLIDEAHLVSPNDDTMYQGFVKALKTANPYLRVIGFTATPWRTSQGKLTDPYLTRAGESVPPLFSHVCYDITDINGFKRLLKANKMALLIPKQTEVALDVEGVKIRGGEFVEKDLQQAVDKEEVTYAALKETIELGHDRKHWLIFASGITHADHICDMLNSLGVSTVAMHSKMPREQADENLRKFKAGEVRAAVNNNMLTTGFDFPAIDMIVCLRPTSSVVFWIQMLGRGTRVHKEKENTLVLDFSRNTQRLGPINDPRLPFKGKKGNGQAPVKTCPKCNCINHISARMCNGIIGEIKCAHEFTFQTKILETACTAELIKLEPVVKTFKIDLIVYSRHIKTGGPHSMMVNYFSGITSFKEFICFEHGGYARRRAVEWWRIRAEESVNAPSTVTEALTKVESIKVPTHLRVIVNKKWPEIIAACFDGTCFGEFNTDESKLPKVAINLNKGKVNETREIHSF